MQWTFWKPIQGDGFLIGLLWGKFCWPLFYPILLGLPSNWWWTVGSLSSYHLKKENLAIVSIPTKEEVFKVLSSLGSSKAPSLDGFTVLFYKKYWSVVKGEVLECVWDFFLNKKMAREQNHTFITLIPKQTWAHLVNHFRPICLCNISYKIISKILANRLKLGLPKIISPLQYAFVPNRSIQHNSIIAHDLLHSFKLKKGKCLCSSRWIWRKPLIRWNGIWF